MSDIKMVAFDLDRTTFIDHTHFSEATIKALLDCREAGVITVPCSGRSIFMIPEILKESVNTKYMIYCNGGYIADFRTEELAYSVILDKEKIIEYFHKVGNEDKLCHKVSTFRHFYDDDPTKIPYGRDIPTVFVDDIYEALENLDEDIYKAEFFFEDDPSFRQKIIDILGDDKSIALSSALSINLEINPAAATKGQGLQRLMDIYGIRKENVMAIGDGDNDVSMFRVAGFSVAMGNGDPAAIEAADAVTASEYEDGFAKAIYKYVL